jgi:hypothetical protein
MRFLREDEFRDLEASQTDPVIRNALTYGGERVFFADFGGMAADFDMPHLGQIIIELFRDNRALQQWLDDAREDSGAIEAFDFPSHYVRVSEALDFVASRPDAGMRRWLRLCIETAVKVRTEGVAKFDLLFFCDTMAHFYCHEIVLRQLIRGVDIRGVFDGV